MAQERKIRRGRRLPSKDATRVWREYIETAEALRSKLASRMQAESALSLGDYHVLLALSEAPDNRLRSSELAARIEWERSRLSHHLGRMEKRGLLRREECPQDNRGAIVVLSEEGESAFHRASRPHLEAVRELFADAFEPEQLEELGSLMGTIRTHLGLEKL